MWNEPSKERLNQMPSLYSTQDTPLQKKEVWLHFFIGGCDWWAVEFDHEGGDIFFGFVIGFEPEFGYFSLSELESVRGPLGLPIERDLHFKPKSLEELRDHYRDNGYAL